MIDDLRVRGATVTGSERAGVAVAERAGRALKKSVMDLGGSDALIVLQDAPLEPTLTNAIWGRMNNTGQSCVAAKRVIVVGEARGETFLAGLTSRMSALRAGDPTDEATTLGPVSSEKAITGLLKQINGATMADGFSQRTGRAALVNLHTAAGMGNALGNIENAWYNRAPLIITAGQQTREILLLEPYLTNVRPLAIAQPFVKWAYEPARPQDVPAAFAWAMAVQPPAGPGFLSIPMDDFEKPCPRPPAARNVSRHLGADEETLKVVIAALSGARSPVLVIGGAVDQAGGWDHAVRLAEKLRCKVGAAPEEGRPGFPETNPLYQGALPGAIKPLCEMLSGHDVIVVIGAPVFRYYPYVAGDTPRPGRRSSRSPTIRRRLPARRSATSDQFSDCFAAIGKLHRSAVFLKGGWRRVLCRFLGCWMTMSSPRRGGPGGFDRALAAG